MGLRPIELAFKTVTRQDVPDAGLFDPSFRVWLNGKEINGAIKNWVDSNPPKDSDPVSYPVLNPDNTIGTLTMSAGSAKKLNLPGHPDYPHYNPPASGAILNGAPLPVITLQEAQDVAKQFGLGPDAVYDPIAPNIVPPYMVSYPDDRRAYSLKLANGVSVAVTQLIAAQNANGIGAPGHWDTTGDAPKWIADFPSPAPDAQLLPVPLVLVPGAKIVSSGMAGMGPAMWEVPDAPNSTPASGGDSLLTPARAAIIDRMGNLLSKFGV